VTKDVGDDADGQPSGRRERLRKSVQVLAILVAIAALCVLANLALNAVQDYLQQNVGDTVDYD
jgi:hypothetical protein